MNKDQIKGTAKEIAGKVQQETGKLVGSEDQQIKGLKKQITGKIQQSAGDVEEIIKAKVRSI
ncbi:MAG: CsbD family protein [Burkholderiaceae bacterium]